MPILPPIVTKIASTALNLAFDIPLTQGDFNRRIYNRSNKTLYMTFSDVTPSATTADLAIVTGRTEVLPAGITELTGRYSAAPTNTRGISLIEEASMDGESGDSGHSIIHATWSSPVEVNPKSFRMLIDLDDTTNYAHPPNVIGLDIYSEVLTYIVPSSMSGGVSACLFHGFTEGGADLSFIYGRLLLKGIAQDINVFRQHGLAPKCVTLDGDGNALCMPTSGRFIDPDLTSDMQIQGIGGMVTPSPGDVITRYRRNSSASGMTQQPAFKVGYRPITA